MPFTVVATSRESNSSFAGPADGQGRLRQLHGYRLGEAVCPKEISLSFIAQMNRDYGVAILKGR
jgi:hypothetical protein